MTSAPMKEMKLKAGRMSYAEKGFLLQTYGQIVQAKYNELVTSNKYAYNLSNLKNFVKFESDIIAFENYYYLQGPDQHMTDVANYFEYGTGIYNTKRAGKWRAGYIKPVIEQYMVFFWKKKGRWSKSKKVKGVKAVYAMHNAIAYMEQNSKVIYRQLRWSYQNE